MISRREMVTGGVFGALSAGRFAEDGQRTQTDDAGVRQALNNIDDELSKIRDVLDDGLKKSSLAYDADIGRLRNTFGTFLKANGKFPEFCEIGSGVFYTIYDWHVKHQQQINIIRVGEQRMAIQYMFTQLILRWEQDPNFIGIPFDR